MIQGYFDDSGKASDPSHRIVVIAGYIAHDQMWWPFQARWRHLLIRHGIPWLHMRELSAICTKKGWGPTERDAIVAEFVGAIRESKLIGIGIAVDAAAWRKLPKKRLKFYGDAQEFCFTRILRRIMDRLDDAQELDPLEIIFDRDVEYSRRRVNLLHSIYIKHEPAAKRIALMAFGDSGRYYQLQAADLLAWETRRALSAKIEGIGKPTARWDELMTPIPYHDLDYMGEWWDADGMDRAFAVVENDHEALTKWLGRSTL